MMHWSQKLPSIRFPTHSNRKQNFSCSFQQDAKRTKQSESSFCLHSTSIGQVKAETATKSAQRKTNPTSHMPPVPLRANMPGG